MKIGTKRNTNAQHNHNPRKVWTLATLVAAGMSIAKATEELSARAKRLAYRQYVGLKSNRGNGSGSNGDRQVQASERRRRQIAKGQLTESNGLMVNRNLTAVYGGKVK